MLDIITNCVIQFFKNTWIRIAVQIEGKDNSVLGLVMLLAQVAFKNTAPNQDRIPHDYYEVRMLPISVCIALG